MIELVAIAGILALAERFTRRPPGPPALAVGFMQSNPRGALWVQRPADA